MGGLFSLRPVMWGVRVTWGSGLRDEGREKRGPKGWGLLWTHPAALEGLVSAAPRLGSPSPRASALFSRGGGLSPARDPCVLGVT